MATVLDFRRALALPLIVAETEPFPNDRLTRSVYMHTSWYMHTSCDTGHVPDMDLP
jgi:hypothetical protein